MRVKGLLLISVVVLLVWPKAAPARLNPLHGITEQMVRPEVMILLDSSGSMQWYPSPEYVSGNDCSGSRQDTVDLCGDGLCSGRETTDNCATDCNISNNNTSTAGSTPACNPNYTSYQSRIFTIKRVLRNLLPPLRKTASFGLTTFKETGYFQYYKGTTGTTKKVTVFFSKTEMQNIGAWDSTNSKPQTTFTWNGTAYTLLSSASLTQTADSLYSRTDNSAVETRFTWATAGDSYNDGTNAWSYGGSYYTYSQATIDTATSQVVTDYKGPQFTDTTVTPNVKWVYNRFNYDYTSQGITYDDQHGLVRVPLSGTATQAAYDTALYQILARMNAATNGGIFAYNNTPTGPGIAVAMDHFVDRNNGTGDFSSVGADPAAACRKRFVLLLSDGQSNVGTAPEDAAHTLYDNTAFTGNPVKTIVVGMPGLPSYAVAELDRIADRGDDGLANSSTTALIATDETSLIKVVKQALLDMVKGDYTTSAASVTTSAGSSVTGNLALVPSTEYPGWQGRLRAYDLTVSSTSEAWDAATLLNAQTYTTRKLYTGFADSASGAPIALLNSDGTVNVTGVKSVWSAAISPSTAPTDAVVRSTVEWIAGKNRSWRLGAIFRSTPAVVGPPPKYSVADHSVYENTYAARDKIVYIATNEGVLHAFRAKDGSEVFGYVPPNLWPKIQTLAKAGGQDPDPASFIWTLASSPRIEDIPSGCTSQGSCTWKTQLTLTMGAGGKAFVVLDVTSPSTCYAGTCTLGSPPFSIVFHSKSNTAIASSIGETWSVPAVYYGYGTTGNADKKPLARVSMGSGYGSSTEGTYYNYFATPWTSSPTTKQHAGTGALVDFAVLPDTVAVIDVDAAQKVVATYQADLNGKIKRYTSGDSAGTTADILSATSSNPFYYSPAALFRGSGKVTLAAVSWSQDEDTTPSSTPVSKMYMLTETDGSVDSSNDSVACTPSQVCSSGACGSTVPTGCTAPGSTAMPVSPPLLVENNVTSGKEVEAFYLFYEPPAAVCSTGNSWIIRLSSTGSSQTVVAAKQFSGVRASGMSIVGGGTDVVITQSGFKGAKAQVQSLTGTTLSGSLTVNAPYIESWREVK